METTCSFSSEWWVLKWGLYEVYTCITQNYKVHVFFNGIYPNNNYKYTVHHADCLYLQLRGSKSSVVGNNGSTQEKTIQLRLFVYSLICTASVPKCDIITLQMFLFEPQNFIMRDSCYKNVCRLSNRQHNWKWR